MLNLSVGVSIFEKKSFLSNNAIIQTVEDRQMSEETLNEPKVIVYYKIEDIDDLEDFLKKLDQWSPRFST